MFAVFLIAIISSGYLIITNCPTHFYKLHRYDGQLLYIKTVFFGSITTLFTFILDFFFGCVEYICKLLPQTESNVFLSTKHLKEYFIFFLLSFLLASIYCFLVKKILIFRVWWSFKNIKTKHSYSYNELSKILLMSTILNDSPLDELLFDSYVDGKFLLITLSNNKVYVGRVMSLGEPTEKQGPTQEIAIVPVSSGFRDKDTQSVILSNYYENSDESKDFYLTLKQDNIISACEFIESLYENSHKSSENHTNS